MEVRPKAFGYVRVSTKDQDTTPEEQARQAEAYYEKIKDEYDWGGIYFDEGTSAYKIDLKNRPEGGRMNSAAGKDDLLIFSKFDRAFRSMYDRCIMEREWCERGVKWVFLDIGIDTTTAMGQVYVGFINLFAQLESGMKSERQIDSHKTRRNQKRAGKAAPPPGWWFNKMTNKFEEDWAEQRAIREWFEWNDNRIQSIKKTCKWLRSCGIKRKSGHWYRNEWLYQARPYMEQGFPCEGYIRRMWKEHGDELRKIKKKARDKGKRPSVMLMRERVQLLKQMNPDQVNDYVHGEFIED